MLIRHLWQLETVVYLHWCLIRAVLLGYAYLLLTILGDATRYDPIFVASTKVAKAGKIASLTTDIFADILALNFANINAALWRLDA